MKEKVNWNWVAQWLVVLLCALTLKLYYSKASANQLRWILAPTATLVELCSGRSFEFESYAGYTSKDRSFVIAPSCAGVNFLITAFLLLAARRLLRGGSQKAGWKSLPAAAFVAYLVTLVANTARIVIALLLKRLPEMTILKADQLHRFEGIFVYFIFLLLLFMISEQISAGKTSNRLRHFFFPLLVYYATALAIPLANGAYRQGSGFWEHAVFVLLIPCLLMLALAPFCWLCKPLKGELLKSEVTTQPGEQSVGSQNPQSTLGEESA